MDFFVLRNEFRGVKGDWELEGVTKQEFAYVRSAYNNETNESFTFTESVEVELTRDELAELHDREYARWNHY